MIKITYEELLSKIVEKTGYTRDTVESLINKKVKQLSGLITREGAAHIVANEIGIKLFDKISGRLKIKNILLGMRDVETVGVVKQNFGVREFSTPKRQGKVASLVIADETGSIRVVFWNNIADIVQKIKVGDIVKIVAGYVRGRNDSKEIHLNDRSKVIINPTDEVLNLDNIKSSYNRKTIQELKDNDRGVELRATIVQVFEPRFYEVCPKCNKKLTLKEGGFFCETHGKVNPKHAYVINLLGDDGTGTIRLVFFRNNVLEVLGKSEEELLLYKDEPEKFDTLRTELLGTEFLVRGRVNVNKLFGKREFIVEDISKPNYENEEKIVKAKIDKLPDEVKKVNVDEVMKSREEIKIGTEVNNTINPKKTQEKKVDKEEIDVEDIVGEEQSPKDLKEPDNKEKDI